MSITTPIMLIRPLSVLATLAFRKAYSSSLLWLSCLLDMVLIGAVRAVALS